MAFSSDRPLRRMPMSIDQHHGQWLLSSSAVHLAWIDGHDYGATPLTLQEGVRLTRFAADRMIPSNRGTARVQGPVLDGRGHSGRCRRTDHPHALAGKPLLWALQPHQELPELFNAIASDRENRVVILTGTGDTFIGLGHGRNPLAEGEASATSGTASSGRATGSLMRC